MSNITLIDQEYKKPTSKPKPGYIWFQPRPGVPWGQLATGPDPKNPTENMIYTDDNPKESGDKKNTALLIAAGAVGGYFLLKG